MTLFNGGREKLPLKEWRIWPFLMACTGTQLAYAIVHIVVEDSFACVLSVFSFIGSLCCIVSRRIEVVLANLLLQAVAFTTLFICCCLGTSSMKIWHENEKLAPLISTQIIFFAFFLGLNGILLILKKRQRQRDAGGAISTFKNEKELFAGRTEGTATTYGKCLTTLQNAPRQQRHSLQQQMQQAPSCSVTIPTSASISCKTRPSIFYADDLCSDVPGGHPSYYGKEDSGSQKRALNPSCQGESEDEEASHAFTVSGGAIPIVGEQLATSSQLVITSQQIETVTGGQHTSMPEQNIAPETFATRYSHNSLCSATPGLHQQSCIFPGRAAPSSSTEKYRVFDTRKRTTLVDAPATARSPVSGSTAIAATCGGTGVSVVDGGRRPKAAALTSSQCSASAQKCTNDRFLERSASCSCPLQTPSECLFSPASSVHNCVSMRGGVIGSGAVAPEQGGLSCSLPTSHTRKYPFAAAVKEKFGRSWDTTLTFLGQAAHCDTVLEEIVYKPYKLQENSTLIHAVKRTPSRSTVEQSVAKADAHVQVQPREVPGKKDSTYSCRQGSIEKWKAREVDVNRLRQASCTEIMNAEEIVGVEGKSTMKGENDSFKVQKPQEFAAQPTFRKCLEVDSGSAPPPATATENKLWSELIDCDKNEAACTSPATSKKDAFCLSGNEKELVDKGIEEREIGGDSWSAEIHQAPEQPVNTGGVHVYRSKRSAGKDTSINSSFGILSSENLQVGGELQSEENLFPSGIAPERMGKDNKRQAERTQRDAEAPCDRLNETSGKQSRMSIKESGKEEELLNNMAYLNSDEERAVSDDELPLGAKSMEALAIPRVAVQVSEAIREGERTAQPRNTVCLSSQWQRGRVQTVPGRAFIEDTLKAVQRRGASNERYNPTRSDFFSSLPANPSADDQDRPSCLLPSLQLGADCRQLSRPGSTLDEYNKLTNLGSHLKGAKATGAPLLTRETTAGILASQERPFPTDDASKRGGALLLCEGKQELLLPVDLAGTSASKRVPITITSTVPGDEDLWKDGHSDSVKCDEDPREAVTTEEAKGRRRCSATRGDLQLSIKTAASSDNADACGSSSNLPTHAAEEVTRRTSSEGLSLPVRRRVGPEEVNRPSECAKNQNTTANDKVEGVNVAFATVRTSTTEGGAASGERFSREKIVYRDRVTTELTPNTTPRVEEEDDSWEDESDENDSHTQERTPRKGDERDGSEWELSDGSGEETFSQKQRQGRGLQKNEITSSLKPLRCLERNVLKGKVKSTVRVRNTR